MSSSEKCAKCPKPATVHLTQIVDNQKKTVHLCDDCAAQNGLMDPAAFSLGPLLEEEGGAPVASGDEERSCEFCGSTFSDFQQSGRLGSAACYDTFRDDLLPLLRGMHRSLRHSGKRPHRGQPAEPVPVRAVDRLLGELEEAIAQERFEDAARLRDQIRDEKEAS